MAIELPVFGLSRLRMTTDGAGITTLVGCLGCPLDCKWCLNPHARLADTRHARVSPERLVELLEQDSIYFSATGGGVTFGGGERDHDGKSVDEAARRGGGRQAVPV